MAEGTDPKPKKKKSKETEETAPNLQIRRLKVEYLKAFTDICYSEGVNYEIKAHIYENEHEFYNIVAKHKEKCFLEWVAYLVKTKVRPDTMDFTVGG